MKTKLTLLIWLLFLGHSLSNAQTGLSFDGTNDFVLGTNNPSLDITQGTVEAWIKTDNAGSDWRVIVNKQQAYGIYLYNNQLAIWDMGNWQGIYTSTNLADNTWHHIAFTFQNNVANGTKIYADGVLILNTTIGVPVSTENILVGASPSTQGGYIQEFNGTIDNVKVWNTVKTETEIYNSYKSCLTGSESNLVMYWDFEEGSGTSLTDLSGNGNNGTLTNMDASTDWVTGYNCEPQDLVAYYPFNGNANDESGNNNHGTINGTTLTTDRFGNPDSAYYFDGATNYISILDNPHINVQTGESFSISFWSKHDAQNISKYMVSKYRGFSGEESYALGTGSNGDSYSWHEFSSGGIENRGSIDLNDNEWHQITSVFKSGESVSIYVDGELDIQHSTSQTGSISNLRNLTIGCGSNIAQFYKGSIDDVKIYNKALTVEEIINESSNLIAHYPFNSNANDVSGYNNHGTVNGATLTTDRFGNPNSAYSFDGNDIITVAHNNILNSSDELSFSVWVKPTTLQNAMILGKSNYTTATNYLLRTKATGYIQFEYKDFADSNSLPLIANDWNHIAVVSNTDNSKQVYINGALASHTTASSPYGLVTNMLTIGARTGNEFFNGSIDDLRIYKSALSESDVLNLFNNNALSLPNEHIKASYNFFIYNNSLHFSENQNLSEVKSVFVYNLLGQEVLKSSEILQEMSFKFLNKGIYILKVEGVNGNTITRKFVIQ